MAKILLVEDNEMNRDMLSRRLERRGHEILIAIDGQQGVDLALSHSPEIILMDMNLPVIDGWEATRRIKASGETKNIPIIALTAHAMSSERDEIFRAGADEYETKPIDFKRLIEKIDIALKNREL